MYWQRRLPHWVPDEAIVFVTWRRAGTLPHAPSVIRDGRSFVDHDRLLDQAATGPRWLVDPRIAAMFVEALNYGESARHAYRLLAWTVMPNHVHLVLRPTHPLPDVMRWLKAATAVRANAVLGRGGSAFWQREYFDRWLRSEKELAATIRYVERNPVTAGLVTQPEGWPWSSAAGDPTCFFLSVQAS